MIDNRPGLVRSAFARSVVALAMAAVLAPAVRPAARAGDDAAMSPPSRWVFDLSAPAAGEPVSRRSISPFPIVMYDTDIGFGYGGRIKLVDFLARRESFDLILFNST